MMRNGLYFLVGMSILAEVLMLYYPVFGVLFYFLLITGVLTALAYSGSFKEEHEMLVIFSIIVLARVIGLFLNFGVIINNIIIYLSLGLAALYYSVRFNKIKKIGFFNKKIMFYPGAIVLGFLVGMAGNYLLNFEKYPNFLFIIPLIAFSEEVLFRGLMQNIIKKLDGRISSIFFTSLFYGIFSMSLGIYAAMFFFVASIVISTVYEYTDNIILTIVINLMIGVVLFV